MLQRLNTTSSPVPKYSLRRHSTCRKIMFDPQVKRARTCARSWHNNSTATIQHLSPEGCIFLSATDESKHTVLPKNSAGHPIGWWNEKLARTQAQASLSLRNIDCAATKRENDSCSSLKLLATTLIAQLTATGWRLHHYLQICLRSVLVLHTIWHIRGLITLNIGSFIFYILYTTRHAINDAPTPCTANACQG